jgi:plasmid stability protein
MPKTVQIRDLDDATYATLRERAAADGLSLAQYLRRELTHLAALPTMAVWLDRVEAGRGRLGVGRDVLAEAIEDLHAERDRR